MSIQVDMHDVARIKKITKIFYGKEGTGIDSFAVTYIDCYDHKGDCLLHIALFNRGTEPAPIENSDD